MKQLTPLQKSTIHDACRKTEQALEELKLVTRDLVAHDGPLHSSQQRVHRSMEVVCDFIDEVDDVL